MRDGMRRAVRWCGAALWVAFASGCLTIGGVQRADTLGKGNFQFALEPGVLAVSDATVGTLVLPTIDLAGRYGVDERVDLGLRLGTTGFELQGKFLLTEPGSTSFAGSIAPTVGGVFLGVLNYFSLNVPFLAGIKLGPHELILGPRIVTQFLTGGAG
ncbi:MAG: hypothetical protein JNG84_09160, partial [Archangium sp.]|nr:hypothetical protein [Archangium sp.]